MAEFGTVPQISSVTGGPSAALWNSNLSIPDNLNALAQTPGLSTDWRTGLQAAAGYAKDIETKGKRMKDGLIALFVILFFVVIGILVATSITAGRVNSAHVRSGDETTQNGLGVGPSKIVESTEIEVN